MPCEIAVMPSGQLKLLQATASESDKSLDKNIDRALTSKEVPWVRRVVTAFERNQSEGLIALATAPLDNDLTQSAAYWRDFAGLFLTALCRGNTDPPDSEQLTKILNAVPPMRGTEYLDVSTLAIIWFTLAAKAENQIENHKDGLTGWLKDNAPLWHQVGRVCFHLAENKEEVNFPFAFLATYSPGISRGGKVQYLPLCQALTEYSDGKNNQMLINLLSPVRLASEKVPLVQDLLKTGDLFHPMMWTADQAHELLKATPTLESCGLLLRLPDWWQKRPSPKAKVIIGITKPTHVGIKAMLDFHFEVVLGDQTLTADEVRAIIAAGDGLQFIKGKWVEVDRKKLEEALEHWSKVQVQVEKEGLPFSQAMRMLAGIEKDSKSEPGDGQPDDHHSSVVHAGHWLALMMNNLKELRSLGTNSGIGPKPSPNFHGTLRPYQIAGLDWLRLLTGMGLGACLADDMGLGKTIQIIALLLSIKESDRKQNRPTLLVLPASLLANWQAELTKFAPSIKASFVHPSMMSAADMALIAGDPGLHLFETDLVVTTYGMVMRLKWLIEKPWHLIILDEAQAIKNPGTKQTKTIKKLQAHTRIALTGTPVENKLADLWSLFDFILPGLLGTLENFKGKVSLMSRGKEPNYTPLRSLVSPYILRRLKSDKSIIADLPDKIEVKVFCGLSKQQAVLYQKTVEEFAQQLLTVADEDRLGLILIFLMRFKQICNHPSQYLGNGAYAEADSGKFGRLRAITEEIASRQEKVLVFTQFREMTDSINALLADVFGRPGLLLHGGTPVSRRQSLVDAFQSEEGPPYMVLTVKAGGVGLNLTAASHVIHFDRWWNPAVENQATDRAYRIGQHRNVMVHKFVCPGTIEEKIDKMITAKTALAGGILEDGAEQMLTKMSNEELLKTVSLDINRVNIGDSE